ncbi:MAG: hypothetical protein HN344_03970, partial [Gammaproteobacteria bacterium]|nr:hypothetical protein [Gammaproteobacteria bacterium]
QIALSCFDKASDESADERMWRCPPQGLDLILFEGWCVGVPPQPVEALVQPINSLEVRLDPDRQWRHFVNEQLAGAYRTLFSRMDVLLVLQAPGMASVVEWRALQEEKMRALQGGGMTPDQVVDFVRYFERLTRHMLVEMPQLADVLLPVGEDHQLDSIHLCQELNPCC